MSKTKKQSECEHFKKRLYERYGIRISTQRVKQICAEIVGKKHTFLEKQSLRTKKYLVDIDGESVIVIYDKNRRMLVTALPK